MMMLCNDSHIHTKMIITHRTQYKHTLGTQEHFVIISSFYLYLYARYREGTTYFKKIIPSYHLLLMNYFVQ